MVRDARLALEIVGDRVVPWRARVHLVLAQQLLFVDPEGAAANLGLAEAALREPGAPATDQVQVELWRADLAMWRRQYQAAFEASDRGHRAASDGPLIAMSITGAHLLAMMLLDDRDGVRDHLGDPEVESLRQSWLDGARRGEHWLLSYEAIRGAARGQIGEPHEARRDLTRALALVGPEPMIGIDEDFLSAFAWICLANGERERARQLLDDTFFVARSPNTIVLATEARERALGITDATTETRIAELLRRAELRDAFSSDDRARRMLAAELGRLSGPPPQGPRPAGTPDRAEGTA